MNTQPSQPTFRLAESADAQNISTLTDAAYQHYIPRLGRKPQPMTADYLQIITEYNAWLLESNQQTLGFIILKAEPVQMFIYSIVVNPPFQKKGWGRSLLHWAEQESLKHNLQKIRLYTNALMVENIALYARSGYQETSREAYLGSTLVHMLKQL